jgi:hypothetical protein
MFGIFPICSEMIRSHLILIIIKKTNYVQNSQKVYPNRWVHTRYDFFFARSLEYSGFLENFLGFLWIFEYF